MRSERVRWKDSSVNSKIVADAARNHKKMPDCMIIGDRAHSIENDPQRIGNPPAASKAMLVVDRLAIISPVARTIIHPINR